MRKNLFALLTLLLLPLTLLAEVEYSYDSGTKTLTLSGSGEMTADKVTALAAIPGVGDATSVVISGDVSSWYVDYDSGAEPVYLGTICPSLQEIIYSEGVSKISACGLFMSCSKVRALTLPSSLTSIGDYALYGLAMQSDGIKNNTSFTTDDLVTKYGLTLTDGITLSASYDSATKTATFGGTGEMTDAAWKVFSLQNTNIYEATSLIIEGDITAWSASSRLANMLPYLQSVTLKEGVTQICDYMFMSCTNLQNITIPSSIKSIGEGAFSGVTIDKSNLTNNSQFDLTKYGLQYPSEVTGSYDSASKTITFGGSGAIYTQNFMELGEAYEATTMIVDGAITEMDYTSIQSYCPNLQKITFTDKVTMTSIGSSAFSNMAALESITLPTTVKSIGDYAFSGCSALKGIDIPEGVTTIGQYAFNKCYSLQSITIPSTVVSIGASAFANVAANNVTNRSSLNLADYGLTYTGTSVSADDVTLSASATFGSVYYIINHGTGATLTAELTSGSDWISNVTVDATNGRVTFTATVNTSTTEDRTATITLKYAGAEDKVVTITQLKAEEEVVIAPEIRANNVTVTANATSGGISYAVTNPTTAALTAEITSGSDWISNVTVTTSDKAGTAGAGTVETGIITGSVSFTATANTSTTEERTATITLKYAGAEDKVVTITQSKAEEAVPAPVISAEDVTIAADVTATTIMCLVTNPIQAEITAEITTGGDWISNVNVVSQTTTGPLAGIITFNSTENTSTTEERTATITLKYPGAEDKVITITQSKAEEAVIAPEIYAEDVTLAADATSGGISYSVSPVTGTGTLSAEITSGSDWISNIIVQSNKDGVAGSGAPSGVELGMVIFSATANTSTTEERTATITLKYPGAEDKVITITQSKAEEVVVEAPVINSGGLILAAEETSGEVSYTVSHATTTANLTAELTSGSDWVSNVTVVKSSAISTDANGKLVELGKVTFSATANTSTTEERTATITLKYPGAEDKVITITQSKAEGSDTPDTPVTPDTPDTPEEEETTTGITPIITPTGTPQMYSMEATVYGGIMGGGTDLDGGSSTKSGIASQVYIDGTDVYMKLFPTVAPTLWAKGTLSGDAITFPMEKIGTYRDTDSETGGYITYDIVLTDKVYDTETYETTYNGLVLKMKDGSIYIDDDFDNPQHTVELSLYKDGERMEYDYLGQELCLKLNKMTSDLTLVTPPETATRSTFLYTSLSDGAYSTTSVLGTVAVDGKDIYFDHLAGVDGWVKGTLGDDGVVTIPASQYLGSDTGYFLYFDGVSYDDASYDEYGNTIFNPHDFRLTLGASGIYTQTDGDLYAAVLKMDNTAYRKNHMECVARGFTIIPFTVKPAIPDRPSSVSVSTYGGSYYLSGTVNNHDVNGEYIVPENIELSLWKDGSILSLSPANGYNISEAITWMPYGWTDNGSQDNHDLTFESLSPYFILNESNVEKLGMQVRYTVEGKTYYSDITYNDVNYNMTVVEVDSETGKPKASDNNFYAQGDVTINDDTDMADRTNVIMHGKYDSQSLGHLTIDRTKSLALGTFTYIIDPYNDANEGTRSSNYSSTLMASSTVTADDVTTRALLGTSQWHFMTLPYDVKVGDITCEDSLEWVAYTYSGANRASGEGSTWQKMSSGDIIPAGVGFIIQSTNTTWFGATLDKEEFFFPAYNESRNNIFANEDVTKDLNLYSSEFAHNSGWNFIGNPFPAYYDTRMMSYKAPFTVWNSNNGQYYTYSPLDDDYLLAPGEAFFVQSSADVTSVTFPAAGRQHDVTVVDRQSGVSGAKGIASAPSREVFNVYLQADGQNDRTRFVINNAASAQYDASVDAAKFDAMQAGSAQVQIYVLKDGTRYAIDERPMGDGRVVLGVKVAKQGEYTISLNTLSEKHVVLHDAVTNATVVLNDQDESYVFTTEAGTFNSRFSITVGDNTATGINLNVNPNPNPNPSATYNLGGQRVNSTTGHGIFIQNGKKITK